MNYSHASALEETIDHHTTFANARQTSSPVCEDGKSTINHPSRLQDPEYTTEVVEELGAVIADSAVAFVLV
jgi:hypothetical protein